MAIIRLYTGSDGQSHFEELTPRFEPRGDQSETAELSPGSRWLTIVLMYLGRVGPLAFAASIALPHEPRGRFRYAYEDVVVG